MKLEQLQRDAAADASLYEYFLGRLKENSINEGIQQADSRILSYGVPRGSTLNRSGTKRRVIMTWVLLAAIGLIIRELLQNGIRVPDELEQMTGLPVMGQIPKIPVGKRRDVLDYLVDKPASAAAEAIRNLRTSVMLSNLDNPPQIIMSTSSVPGEGKTTQSIALTQNFAAMGKKVLLIEGDIRRRVFSEYFSIEDKAGLLSVLSGSVEVADVIVHEPRLDADVLVGEPSKTNAADVFSSERFGALLQEARRHYDIIIIDTPPVLVVPDARVIGQKVDAILYTVKWNTTTKAQLREGLRFFETVNLKVSGLVLGQIDPAGMKRYGYGDRYGAYGKYGKKYYTS